MLYTTTHHWGTIITMGGLHLVKVEPKPTPLFLFPTLQYSIVLSSDLLAWIAWIPVEGRIPCSFTNFITTPELSGPLYISPDIYHTQVTEYSLQTFYE